MFYLLSQKRHCCLQFVNGWGQTDLQCFSIFHRENAESFLGVVYYFLTPEEVVVHLEGLLNDQCCVSFLNSLYGGPLERLAEYCAGAWPSCSL